MQPLPPTHGCRQKVIRGGLLLLLFTVVCLDEVFEPAHDRLSSRFGFVPVGLCRRQQLLEAEVDVQEGLALRLWLRRFGGRRVA